MTAEATVGSLGETADCHRLLPQSRVLQLNVVPVVAESSREGAVVRMGGTSSDQG